VVWPKALDTPRALLDCADDAIECRKTLQASGHRSCLLYADTGVRWSFVSITAMIMVDLSSGLGASAFEFN
jgi:hypothetical protein